jgi:hypothetical protein
VTSWRHRFRTFLEKHFKTYIGSVILMQVSLDNITHNIIIPSPGRGARHFARGIQHGTIHSEPNFLYKGWIQCDPVWLFVRDSNICRYAAFGSVRPGTQVAPLICKKLLMWPSILMWSTPPPFPRSMIRRLMPIAPQLVYMVTYMACIVPAFSISVFNGKSRPTCSAKSGDSEKRVSVFVRRPNK